VEHLLLVVRTNTKSIVPIRLVYTWVCLCSTILHTGANVDPGYIVTAQDAITVPTIGVFNGCFFTDANTLKPTFSSFYPGGTTPAANVNNGDTDAFVIDNPWQQYVGQLDARLGATGDAAQVTHGKNVRI
jgi:hypothetical protein